MGLETTRTFKYAVVGDLCYDRILTATTEQFEAFSILYNQLFITASPMTAAQALHVGKKQGLHRNSRPGGPVFNIAQYLRMRGQDVSAVGIVGGNRGRNRESGNLVSKMRAMGVDTSMIRTRPQGKLAECVYVVETEGDRRELVPFWEGNVSNDTSYNVDVERLNQHDMMIFSVTHPDVCMRALYGFRKLLAYNPGQLMDYETVETARVPDILPHTHILGCNSLEACWLRDGFSLEHITGLFQIFPNIQYILNTRGGAGSSIYQRGHQSEIHHVSFDPTEVTGRISPDQIVDTIGPGDAYFATAVALIMRGLDLESVIRLASDQAEEALRHQGGTNPRFIKRHWKPDSTAIRGVKRSIITSEQKKKKGLISAQA